MTRTLTPETQAPALTGERLRHALIDERLIDLLDLRDHVDSAIRNAQALRSRDNESNRVDDSMAMTLLLEAAEFLASKQER
jgi:hypothetical protein